MKNKFFKSWSVKFAFVLAMIFSTITTVYAGFGISPPYVSNQQLTRGSVYEQKIILVRGDPAEDLKAELTINIPEANDWISVDKGTEFILPKGEKQIPIVVKVKVPNSAAYKAYKGKINITTSSVDSAAGGAVGIALGGQIDVDLIVTDQIVTDFKINGVAVKDLEATHEWLFWNVPGMIDFEMQLENLGNVAVAPSKVVFDIYDSNNETLLEKTEAIKVGESEPSEIKWVTAQLPTDLTPGSYWAKYQIDKGDQVVKEDKLHLSILPYGALNHTPFEEFSRMKSGDQVQFLLIFAGLLLVLGIITFIISYRITKRLPKK